MQRLIAIALSSTFMLQAATLIAAPPAAPRPGAAPSRTTTGAIAGIARTPTGQVLPNSGVQVRNLQTGQVAGTAISNEAGRYSFAGIPSGSYVVEVVTPTGAIVGASASTLVVAGSAATVPVSATATAAAARAFTGSAAAAGPVAGASGSATRPSTAMVVTTAAGRAGVAGVIIVDRDDASPVR